RSRRRIAAGRNLLVAGCRNGLAGDGIRREVLGGLAGHAAPPVVESKLPHPYRDDNLSPKKRESAGHGQRWSTAKAAIGGRCHAQGLIPHYGEIWHKRNCFIGVVALQPPGLPGAGTPGKPGG